MSNNQPSSVSGIGTIKVLRGGKRDVLEGRFVWLAVRAPSPGVNVVLDFDVWSRAERSALRYLASSVGATCELV
jgi:hypothetical protein